jgi:hypothetical protein
MTFRTISKAFYGYRWRMYTGVRLYILLDSFVQGEIGNQGGIYYGFPAFLLSNGGYIHDQMPELYDAKLMEW